MKKLKSAPRANFASVVAVGQLDPNALIDACQLSAARNISIRSITTLKHKGVLSYFAFGHRMHRFTVAQFDKDIAAYQIKSIANRNGRGRK